MHITSLQPQATNPDRINIFADDQFLLGVNALLVLQLELRVGQELTPDQLTHLRNEEALHRAIERSLNYLSFRPHSREEVRRYLRHKETPPELIDSVLDHLANLDLLNDRTFASFWIESREQFSPRGSIALKNELRMKGVEREVIDELIDDEQDEERALRAGYKKALALVRLPNIDFATFRTRLGSFLQRRGFSYEISTRIMRKLWEELKGQDDDDPE